MHVHMDACTHPPHTCFHPVTKKQVSVPAWGYLRFIKSLVWGEHGRQDRKGLTFSTPLFGRCVMRHWLFAFYLSWHLDFVKFDITQGPICLLCLLWRRKHDSLSMLLIVPESSGFLRTGCQWAHDTQFCGLCQSLLFVELKHFAFFLMKTPYNQQLLLEHNQH